jgi:hypothetical protein
MSLIEIYEVRFGPMSRELRTAVATVYDQTVLLGWLRVFTTHSADEIAAVLRPVRDS